jgi:hypothetical protein
MTTHDVFLRFRQLWPEAEQNMTPVQADEYVAVFERTRPEVAMAALSDVFASYTSWVPRLKWILERIKFHEEERKRREESARREACRPSGEPDIDVQAVESDRRAAAKRVAKERPERLGNAVRLLDRLSALGMPRVRDTPPELWSQTATSLASAMLSLMDDAERMAPILRSAGVACADPETDPLAVVRSHRRWSERVRSI